MFTFTYGRHGIWSASQITVSIVIARQCQVYAVARQSRVQLSLRQPVGCQAWATCVYLLTTQVRLSFMPSRDGSISDFQNRYGYRYFLVSQAWSEKHEFFKLLLWLFSRCFVLYMLSAPYSFTKKIKFHNFISLKVFENFGTVKYWQFRLSIKYSVRSLNMSASRTKYCLQLGLQFLCLAIIIIITFTKQI